MWWELVKWYKFDVAVAVLWVVYCVLELLVVYYVLELCILYWSWLLCIVYWSCEFCIGAGWCVFCIGVVYSVLELVVVYCVLKWLLLLQLNMLLIKFWFKNLILLVVQLYRNGMLWFVDKYIDCENENIQKIFGTRY